MFIYLYSFITFHACLDDHKSLRNAFANLNLDKHKMNLTFSCKHIFAN